MPDVDCLNEKIVNLEHGQMEHSVKIELLASKVDQNTKITIQGQADLKSDLGDILEFLKWGRASKKYILIIGAFIGGMLGGISAIAEWIKHYK